MHFVQHGFTFRVLWAYIFHMRQHPATTKLDQLFITEFIINEYRIIFYHLYIQTSSRKKVDISTKTDHYFVLYFVEKNITVKTQRETLRTNKVNTAGCPFQKILLPLLAHYLNAYYTIIQCKESP